jgi:hypothetical protein
MVMREEIPTGKEYFVFVDSIVSGFLYNADLRRERPVSLVRDALSGHHLVLDLLDLHETLIWTQGSERVQ